MQFSPSHCTACSFFLACGLRPQYSSAIHPKSNTVSFLSDLLLHSMSCPPPRPHLLTPIFFFSACNSLGHDALLFFHRGPRNPQSVFTELANSVLWTGLCLPIISQAHMLRSLTASVTASEERTFAEVIRVK